MLISITTSYVKNQEEPSDFHLDGLLNDFHTKLDKQVDPPPSHKNTSVLNNPTQVTLLIRNAVTPDTSFSVKCPLRTGLVYMRRMG